MSSPQPLYRSMHSSNAVVSKLRPFSTCFIPPTFLASRRRETTWHGKVAPSTRLARNSVHTEQLRTFFVDALVRAGSNHDHFPEGKPFRKGRRKSSIAVSKAAQGHEVQPATDKPHPTPYTREDYLGLVDFYDDWSSKDSSNGKQGRGQDSPLSWSERDIRPNNLDEYDGEMLDRVISRLDKLLTDDGSEPEDVFAVYKQLPSPGVKFLDREQRIYLVRKLSVMEHKSSVRTIAYLSVLDDYREAEIPIPRHAWNSAMSLGSTTLRKITDVEVEFALRTWKEMELEAGVRGSEVTFNILFDIASKAGKFSLAEMILKEMEARKIEITRFTRVGMILYHGLRKEGNAVRQSYKDFVEAHEVVDTVVLNCLISALMTAGEPDAAHAVFDRMKEMARKRESTSYVPKLWSKRRELGSMLKWIAKQAREAKKNPQKGRPHHIDRMLGGMQDMISIAPDIDTCNILLRHYCTAGEFQRVVSVLEDMQEFGIVYNNKTFADLFRGFATFGIVRYTAWTTDRLENTWQACLELLESGEMDLNDRAKLMVIWALVATRRLKGEAQAGSVYRTLQGTWRGEDKFDDIFMNPTPAGGIESAVEPEIPLEVVEEAAEILHLR